MPEGINATWNTIQWSVQECFYEDADLASISSYALVLIKMNSCLATSSYVLNCITLPLHMSHAILSVCIPDQSTCLPHTFLQSRLHAP